MAVETILRPQRCLLPIIMTAVVFLMGGSLASCAEPTRPGLERVTMKESTFWVEGVFDDETRIRGLGGRDSLPDDGGMLFVFPRANILEFVMRDCKFDIDIAFLDDSGRVVAVHTMKMDPRKPGESDIEYEDRLQRYSSRFASRFALELKPGTLDRLGVKDGDMVQLDAEGLKRRAK